MGNNISVRTWVMPHFVGSHGEAITITLYHNLATYLKRIEVNGVEQWRKAITLGDFFMTHEDCHANLTVNRGTTLDGVTVGIYWNQVQGGYYYKCWNREREIHALEDGCDGLNEKHDSLLQSVKGVTEP